MTNTNPTADSGTWTTAGALELSTRDAATWTRLFGERTPILTVEQGEALRAAGQIGERLLANEGEAMWEMFSAERRAVEDAANVAHEAQRVTEHLAAGHRTDGGWVTQAAGRLADVLAQRQAAVDALIANRHLIGLLLADRDAA
jgi:hypothetical protein